MIAEMVEMQLMAQMNRMIDSILDVEPFEDDEVFTCLYCKEIKPQTEAVCYSDYKLCTDCSQDGEALELMARTLEVDLDVATARICQMSS